MVSETHSFGSIPPNSFLGHIKDDLNELFEHILPSFGFLTEKTGHFLLKYLNFGCFWPFLGTGNAFKHPN